MPDDFICIAEKEKRCKFNGGVNKLAIERLFVHKDKLELYNKMMNSEPSLW